MNEFKDINVDINNDTNINNDIPLPIINNNIKSSKFIINKNEPNLNLYNLTSLQDDSFEKDLRTAQSLSIGNYEIRSFYPEDCGQTQAKEIQLSQPNINFTGGKGWVGSNGCLIDNDTYLRFKENTNKRYINQLQERLVKTSPYIKGILDVDIESKLLPGNKTDSKKSVTNLSGINMYDRHVTPLIPKLQNQVQNPEHLIQEVVNKEWVHGGMPTRQIMRNIDYINKCKKN